MNFEKPIIEVKNLILRKGQREILNLPELSLNSGEVLAIIGPNGAGKTSLLQILALLERPTSGEIYYRGQAIDFRKNLLPWRRRVTMLFQDPLLLDGTVFANVAAGLTFRGIKKEELRPRVQPWLRQFGVEHLATRSARLLSGGEAQRVALARALALEPEVLLLDEPFSSLDYPTRVRLLEELSQVLRSTGVTAVFVTHDYTEVLALAHRLGVLMGGRLEQLGEPGEVLQRPANSAVAHLLSWEDLARHHSRISSLVKQGKGGDKLGEC